MKKFLLLLIVSFFPIIAHAGSDSTDLLSLFEKGPFGYSNTNIILPQFDKKITKANGYIKFGNYLYMVANTWNDSYTKMLGSYLVRYDVSTRNIEKLTPKLFGDTPTGAGFVFYYSKTATNPILTVTINSKLNSSRYIYDLVRNKTITINPSRFPKNGNKKPLSWNILPTTYDTKSIKVNVLYSGSDFNLDPNIEGNNTITYIFR
ncbi:hypothetical protein K2X92_04715 [Candidatus Gracilibacteria bacterium]|nr:hypothetical protein [Candidatus Gracilibacteria bacterium]